MKLLYVSLLLPLLAACETLTEPEAPDLLKTPPDQARPVVITGRVVNAATTVGIQGANVRVIEGAASVGTDENGRYRIVLPARFRGRAVPVQVRAIGFKPQSRTVALSGDPVIVDLAIAVDFVGLTCVAQFVVAVDVESTKRGFTVTNAPASKVHARAGRE